MIYIYIFFIKTQEIPYTASSLLFFFAKLQHAKPKHAGSEATSREKRGRKPAKKFFSRLVSIVIITSWFAIALDEIRTRRILREKADASSLEIPRVFCWQRKKAILVHARVPCGVPCELLGSLRNDDDDGNENGNKAKGLDKQNNNFARASRPFLYIYLPSLHDYNYDFFYFLFLLMESLRIQLQKKLPIFDELNEME